MSRCLPRATAEDQTGDAVAGVDAHFVGFAVIMFIRALGRSHPLAGPIGEKYLERTEIYNVASCTQHMEVSTGLWLCIPLIDASIDRCQHVPTHNIRLRAYRTRS